MVLYIDGEFHFCWKRPTLSYGQGVGGGVMVTVGYGTRAHFTVGPLVSSGKRGFDRFSVNFQVRNYSIRVY